MKKKKKCKSCHGDGELWVMVERGEEGRIRESTPCADCKGTGKETEPEKNDRERTEALERAFGWKRFPIDLNIY